MSVSEGFTDFVLDQLNALDDLTQKRMFSGVGLYAGDCFFGIIWNDTLFLKTGEPIGNARRSKPFEPYRRRARAPNYYAVPPATLEDADELLAWARRALQFARRVSATPRGRP